MGSSSSIILDSPASITKETGLHYNYFRTYNPGTGAYTSVDPLGLAGGSFSTYQYAYSNPLSYTDPMGLFTVNLDAYAGIGGGISVPMPMERWKLSGV